MVCHKKRMFNGHPRKGTAAVEFAVVSPVLLAVIFGALELGCAFHTLDSLQNAAREGARKGITINGSVESVMTACQNSLLASKVKGTQITVTPDPQEANSGSMIRVTVTAAYCENSWVPLGKWGEGKFLTASVAMMKE